MNGYLALAVTLGVYGSVGLVIALALLPWSQRITGKPKATIFDWWGLWFFCWLGLGTYLLYDVLKKYFDAWTDYLAFVRYQRQEGNKRG